MALSTQTHTVSGVPLSALVLTISYLRSSHLSVYVDGTLTTGYSVGGNTLSFSPAINIGSVVQVRRTTPQIAPIHTYSGQAQWRPATVDESFLQCLYLQQENSERPALVGNVNASGNLTVAGTSTVQSLAAGATTVQSLTTPGAVLAGGVGVSGNLAVAGTSTVQNLTVQGAVAGLNSGMVGLGSCNNTSDASKPVSTATQTALNLKANLAAPTLTGNTVLDHAASHVRVQNGATGYGAIQLGNSATTTNNSYLVGTNGALEWYVGNVGSGTRYAYLTANGLVKTGAVNGASNSLIVENSSTAANSTAELRAAGTGAAGGQQIARLSLATGTPNAYTLFDLQENAGSPQFVAGWGPAVTRQFIDAKWLQFRNSSGVQQAEMKDGSAWRFDTGVRSGPDVASTPALMWKKFTGTSPAAGGSVNIAHGLTSTKVVHYNCIIDGTVGGRAQSVGDGLIPGGTNGYSCYGLGATNITLAIPSAATDVASKPYCLTIWYEA